MNCTRCRSDRVASVSAKCADLCSVHINHQSSDGGVPHDMGIGSGDYVNFQWCLECGQIQGHWPKMETELETNSRRKCENCGEELPAGHVAVYCSNACAAEDA